MFQEAEGRNDAAIKRTAAEAVSETFERHPDALGGATAAALRSVERALSTAASSGQAAKQPTARVTSGTHRPAALGERQLRRLLGALRAWSRRSSRRRLERRSCKAASGDGLFVRTAPPRSVNGSCSGSWERCTSAVLLASTPPPFGGPTAKPRRWPLFCAHRPAARGERYLQRILGGLHERGSASTPPPFGGPAAMKPSAIAPSLSASSRRSW